MKTKYVLCLNNDGYEVSLERFKVYKAINDATALKHNQIKIIDESGEDYYYPGAWPARSRSVHFF